MTFVEEPHDASAPAWSWPLDRSRALVSAVRGRPAPRNIEWPQGARVAVAISVDVDHETPWLRDGLVSPAGLAFGDYGARRGLPRLLDMFERFAVPATFFVPAVSAELHPESVQAIGAAGHEVASHGWIHERPELLDRCDEAALLDRSLETLERLSGRRPVGQRTPSFGCSEHTLDLARDAGLRYDSSLMADDEPYELLLGGEPSGLMEVPVDWSRDDAAFLVMDRYGGVRPVPEPAAVVDAWRAEYVAARAEGGLFQLTLHPDLSGRRGPAAALGRLLEHITADGGVWFATHDDVAEHCRQEAPR